MRQLELLSPAKNLQVCIAAINHGADAVYIGGPAFGARSAATNSIDDISTLIQYAHQFNVKVYVAFNTLLYDDELERAIEIAHKLYDIHADALIIQDLGLLQCDLPPIALHASTQLNNRTPEKVDFLEKIGFSQVVLARELNLTQIKAIAEKTTVPLEFFIHGALCVCYSGQCYMSEYATGRSGNRGECAQMCRHKYTLQGLGEAREGYFLSTKDMCLEHRLEDLISAGISSFKIEGRLKDENYVKNVTAFYRKKLDAIIAKRTDLQRSSTGICTPPFTPDINKTFTRGYTEYYIEKQQNKVANIRSPKSQGEYLGKVVESNETASQRGKNFIKIKTTTLLHNGDGLCFYDSNGELTGVQINGTNEGKIVLNKNVHIPVGTEIWRNVDVDFQKQLESSNQGRKLPVKAVFRSNELHYSLTLSDAAGNTATIEKTALEIAKNQNKQRETITSQVAKMGDSIFLFSGLEFEGTNVPFIPIADINSLRRETCDLLRTKIIESVETLRATSLQQTTAQYPMTEPHDFRLNVANQKAVEFFHQHGVEVSQRAFECQHRENVPLMTTKYCIRYQLGACKKGNAEPLFLSDKSHSFRVEFDCDKCEMNIFSL
ncbi:MAG: U32 family peptidase [Bacteroidales bacterium]|nr:U32 family peptidase [Bacteroidales bacterium]